MLYGNYSVLCKSAGKWIGGGATGQGMYRSDFNHTNSMMNIFFQDISSGSQVADLSAIPNGYLPPYSWLLPLSGGGMASFTNVVGSGNPTHVNLAGGINTSASLSGMGYMYDANLIMVIWLLSSISGSSTFNADIFGKLEALANIIGSSTVEDANLVPILWGMASILANSNMSGDIVGILDAISDLSGSGDITTASLLSTLAALCTIAGTSSVDFDITGKIEIASNMLGNSDLESSLLAIAELTSEIIGTSTMSGSFVAKGFMGADITPFTELSPQNLAAAVWNALASSYDTVGTMGYKMNTGGAGISVEDIWSYNNRTLTSASSILSTQIDGVYTLEQILQIMVATLAGKLSGGGTNTLTFRDLSDTLDRITVTVNNLAERTEVITNV